MIKKKITVKEAAQLIRIPVSIQKIHQMIADGQFKTAEKIGSMWWIDKDEVIAVSNKPAAPRGNPNIKTLRRKTLARKRKATK